MTKFATLTPNGLKDEREMDISKMPSSDPLAFAYGIQAGQVAVRKKNEDGSYVISHGSPWKELAPEYLRGFLFGYRQILVPEGTKINKGNEQSLLLQSKNIYKPPK